MNYIKKIIQRSIREGTLQLWRNRFLSSTTILLGALILFLLNFIFAIGYSMDLYLQRLESRTDFSIPLRQNYEPFQLASLKNDLDKFKVETKILREERFSDFTIGERLHIKFFDLKEVPLVFKRLKNLRYDKVIGDWDGLAERDFVILVDKLLTVRTSIEMASFWLTIIFMIGGILLAINAFRLVLFSRRQEILVSRLVGADTSFIAGPFLWEAILLGSIAAFVSQIVFIFVLREITFLPRSDIFEHLWNNIFGLELLVAAIVSLVGSWLAIKKYLIGSFS